MKIVNGTIVRDGDVPPTAPAYAGLPTTEGGEASSSGSGGLSAVMPEMPEFFRRTVTICGSAWSYGYISFLIAISFLFNGCGGVFFTGACLGGFYLYGKRLEGQSNGGASAPGTSGGMQRMNTRPGGGGSNIKGISDLPKPPPSS